MASHTGKDPSYNIHQELSCVGKVFQWVMGMPVSKTSGTSKNYFQFTKIKIYSDSHFFMDELPNSVLILYSNYIEQ